MAELEVLISPLPMNNLSEAALPEETVAANKEILIIYNVRLKRKVSRPFSCSRVRVLDLIQEGSKNSQGFQARFEFLPIHSKDLFYTVPKKCMPISKVSIQDYAMRGYRNYNMPFR